MAFRAETISNSVGIVWTPNSIRYVSLRRSTRSFTPLGTGHYFFDGRGWEGGNFLDKLFAETVNTEINCMQVRNKVFAGRRRHKINCLQQKPLIKKCFYVKNKKNNDPFLTEISPKSPLLCVSRSPFRYGFRAGAYKKMSPCENFPANPYGFCASAKVIRWSVSLALISSLYRKPSQ